MAMQKTLIILKPNAVKRNLVGKIIERFELKGLEILEMAATHATREQLVEHYKEHEGKSFFESTVNFMMSGKIVALLLRGKNAIEVGRTLIGGKGAESLPGTIRGDFCMCVGRNIIHGSSSESDAAKEAKIWFPNFVEREVKIDDNLYEGEE